MMFVCKKMDGSSIDRSTWLSVIRVIREKIVVMCFFTAIFSDNNTSRIISVIRVLT